MIRLRIASVLWILSIAVSTYLHAEPCHRRVQDLQSVLQRRTFRIHDLVRRVRQQTEANIRRWCNKALKSSRVQGLEKNKKNKPKKTKQKKVLPYRPPNLIEKMKKVKSIDDFVKVFHIKNIQKSYVKPQGLTGSCEKGAACITQPAVEKYTVKTDSQEDSAAMDFRVDDTTCKPRTVIHPLPLPNFANFVYYPSCVEAARCGGCCTDNINFKCDADDKTIEKRLIMQVFYNGSAVSTKLDIEHHKSCKCKCVYSQADCLPTQTFDPNNCQCECRRKSTQCGPDKQWSQGYCDCVCSRPTNCSTYKVWDSSTCRCVCPTTPCPNGSYRDRNTCECRT